MKKLLPCPGCGLVDEQCVRVVNVGRRERVQCICGWQGPAVDTIEEAAKAWNKRVSME